MWPDRVSNLGPLPHEPDALLTALRGLANLIVEQYKVNHIALRKAKIAYNFGLSECSRVKEDSA